MDGCTGPARCRHRPSPPRRTGTSLPTTSFARSATKHRISRERSLYVIEHCGIQFVDRYWNRTTADIDRKVYFLGDDLEEVALEVVAAESAEEDFKVIHAMELRKRFYALYEEARSWAK